MLRRLALSAAALAAIALTPSAVAQDRMTDTDRPVRTDISAAFDYAAQHVDVFDARMRYFEAGEGDPILFVHGIPTWSYIWRNIMPHLEDQGRVIAVDMPGFGGSELGSAQTAADQNHYLERFIETLGLTNVTLVIQDLGGVAGLSYAARNPENVKAIVMMEVPIRQLYTETPAPDAIFPVEVDERWLNFIQLARDPELAHQVLVEGNGFLGADGASLQASLLRQLSPEERAAYLEPFSVEADREFLVNFPASIAIDGLPAESAAMDQRHGRFLIDSEIPKLLFTVEQGSLIPPDLADRMEAQIPNLRRVNLEPGRHHVQEDYPHVIGRTIAEWLPDARRRTYGASQTAERAYMLNIIDFDGEAGLQRYRDYLSAAFPLMREYGGRLYTSYRPREDYVGTLSADLVGVVEWPNEAAVRAFFDDPRYAELEALRDSSALSLQIIRMESTTRANDPVFGRGALSE